MSFNLHVHASALGNGIAVPMGLAHRSMHDGAKRCLPAQTASQPPQPSEVTERPAAGSHPPLAGEGGRPRRESRSLPAPSTLQQYFHTQTNRACFSHTTVCRFAKALWDD